MSSIDELRDMADGQLQQKLEENRERLFKLRYQLETRQEKNHQALPHFKREIAQIMTILRERELMRMYGGEETEAAVEQAAAPAESAARRRGLFGRRK